MRTSAKQLIESYILAVALIPAAWAATPATHISAEGPSWLLRGDASSSPLFRSAIEFETGGVWVRTSDYPQRSEASEEFHDAIGQGIRTTVVFAGRPQTPALSLEIVNYRDRAWATISIKLSNRTGSPVPVSRIRILEVADSGVTSIVGDPAQTRVLSDSYSEDTPVLRIHNFAAGLPSDGLAVGSQLVYNRQSHQSFFAGVLTSRKWLTVFHLTSSGYTADCEGTTELTTGKSLDVTRPQDSVTLQLEIPPGGELDSERLAISTQSDYLESLRQYGVFVRLLHNARANAPAPWGWWSYTAFYNKLSDGLTATNAAWLSAHLRDKGYNYLHLDEGYNFARGEYTTTDPDRFPQGMEDLARRITRLGLVLGVWTAPFEVSERSWVYRNHKDWLVENDRGDPIHIGRELYALDTTNPGAQDYLRETYSTLVHRWGVGYIKMDFMEESAVEGKRYRANTSAMEALLIGLGIIRDTVGDDVILDKDGSPMLAPVGIVDAGRLSNDTEHSFAGTFDAATGIAARFYMNRNFFIADPDAFCVSNNRSKDPHWGELKPLTFEEAKAAIALAAMAGGMFEDGDDLPALGNEKERIALLTNPQLLKLVRLQRSATPLDLMTYAPEDRQPSLFWTRESARQSILAVFNWSEAEQRHNIPFPQLGIAGKAWRAEEIFSAAGVKLSGQMLSVDQPAHSVRVIRLVNRAVEPLAPPLQIRAGDDARAGRPMTFTAASASDNPVVRYTWDFGDGTRAAGQNTAHTFTHAGEYRVTIHAESVDGPVAAANARIIVDEKLDAHAISGCSTVASARGKTTR